MSVNKKIIEAEATTPAPPDPPADSFNIILYTGDRPTNSGKTGVGFQPDLVVIKGRNQTDFWSVLDSTRGANVLSIDSTQTESAFSGWSFDSDGFTIGSSGQANSNGEPYVAFCWRANGGTTSSNTDGSVTSTVQAKTSAGFSIVKYTGTGSNATIGHGLTAAPEVMLIKNLDQTDAWVFYHYSLGTSDWMSTVSTDAASGTGTIFGTPNDVGVAPTSSVFTVGSNHKSGASGEDYIAYCFHSVAGYSKFGSYTGTGGDLTVVTGFEPSFLMVKRTDAATYDWYVVDSVRNPTDYRNKIIRLNSTTGEQTVTNGDVDVKFISNGFEFDNIPSSSGGFNATGGTYIYMVFKISS